MTTYYLIDTRTNEIVNACESNSIPNVDRFVDSEFLRYDSNPAQRLLDNYKYYNERP